MFPTLNQTFQMDTPTHAEAAVRTLLEAIFPTNTTPDLDRFLPLALILLQNDHRTPWRQRQLSGHSEWSSRLDRNIKTRPKQSQEQTVEKVNRLYQQLQSSLPASFHHGFADNIMNVLTRLIDFHPSYVSSSTRASSRSTSNIPIPPVSNSGRGGFIMEPQVHLQTLETKDIASPGKNPNLSLTLQSSRIHHHNIKYEEVKLLRECILALEHVDGENIRFFYPNPWDDNDDPTEENEDQETSRFDIWTTNTVMMQYAGLRIRSNILPMHTMQSSPTQGKNDFLLGSGSMDALRICGEAGWLYHKIQSFVQSTHISKDTFVTPCSGVAKALACALQNEMESFQTLVAALEKRLVHPLETDITSRKLMVELRKPIQTLRSLALLADGISPSMGGGEILTALYFHSLHGDIRHRELMTNILTIASKPWYDVLFHWIFHGMLPVGEMKSRRSLDDKKESKDTKAPDFFVYEDVTVEDVNMWQGRYQLMNNQIPIIPCMTSRVNLGTGSGYDESSLLGQDGVGAIMVDIELANEALIVGKGINFIRKCLVDSEWIMNWEQMLPMSDRRDQANMTEREHLKTCLGFHYKSEDISSSRNQGAVANLSLRNTINMASSQVHEYILQSLVHQHHLIEHLRGLKDFLLLGQGDFISAMIDSLYTDIGAKGSAKTGLYLHQVLGIVQDALRATNAAFLPKFVLDSVGVKLMTDTTDRIPFWLSDKKYPSSFSDQDLVEDPLELFSLEYSVKSPLAAVVYPTVLKKYQRIFSLLFRLKRIEWMLNRSWKQSRALFHALQAEASKYVNILDDHELEALTRTKVMMRKVSTTRQSMLHFLSNIQSYLMFEVLEVGWKDLMQDLRQSKTLDEVIKAHNLYLNTILKKSLLGDDSSLGGNYPNKMERQLRIVLTIAYRFCQLHDSIFGEANQAIEAAAVKRRRGESRISAGEWGYDDVETDDYSMNMFTLSDEVKLQKVSYVSSDFESSIRDLLQLLNDKINDGPPNDDSSIFFSPSADSYTIASTSSLSDTGSKRSKKVVGPVIESDALQFLAFRLDFSDFYERSSA